MHEIQTSVTDVRDVCQAAQLGGMCSVCSAFTAAVAKLHWHLDSFWKSFILGGGLHESHLTLWAACPHYIIMELSSP